jgi:glycine/D-amino acid oxidase-like deaminating enzyme
VLRDSIWLRTLGDADRSTLEASDELPASADVVVVGAGLIGLATAYYLVAAGVSNVCVVDRGDLLSEASGANAGGLWFAHQSLAAGSAIGLVHEGAALYDALEDEFSFDRTCGGALELVQSEAAIPAAKQRTAAIRKAGFEAEWLTPADLIGVEPALRGDFVGGILLPDDGQLHPAMLAAGWVRRIREAGGSVCAGVEATTLGPPVETSAGSIETECVVVACGSWTPLLTQTLGWSPPIHPVRGTLLALPEHPLGAVRTTILGDKFYWWQLASGAVVGGGSEEHVGFDRTPNDSIVADIRADLASCLPSLASSETVCSWSGFRPRCDDELPVIGYVPGHDDIFVAAGHFRMGVMTAPSTGLALAQLIVEGETDIDLSAMEPERFTPE